MQVIFQTLNATDIKKIYQSLIEDSEERHDPIHPAGIKDLNLLESAVSRQHTSLGGAYKYDDPILSAASLCYGICSNHPFHNGNKRAALVSMLAHMDKNNLVLRHIDHSTLTGMMVHLANHSMGDFRHRIKWRRSKDKPGSPDFEVLALADWLDEYSERINHQERQITFRELRRILKRFGFVLENPSKGAIEIVRYEERNVLGYEMRPQRKHIYTIGYPGESKIVTLADMRRLRKFCKLTADDGCDSNTFYDEHAIVDRLINKYRKTLRALRNK